MNWIDSNRPNKEITESQLQDINHSTPQIISSFCSVCMIMRSHMWLVIWHFWPIMIVILIKLVYLVIGCIWMNEWMNEWMKGLLIYCLSFRSVTRSQSGSQYIPQTNWWAAYLGRTEWRYMFMVNFLFSHLHLFGAQSFIFFLCHSYFFSFAHIYSSSFIRCMLVVCVWLTLSQHQLLRNHLRWSARIF